ncbi:MAG: threonine--tRNA ligase [Acholeplasmataceae bacterium]|jgi:threonyl-tRNA synthetase|nr:threonine--tRNA ligase [Acholeplasmataceae bacterium]
MMNLILPDKSGLKVRKGITPGEIAKDISLNLFKNALGASLNQRLIELDYPIDESGDFKIITKADQEAFYLLNHSAAHLMAEAIRKLYPKALFGVGPAIKEGFYYDVDFGDVKISDSDLEKIEETMRDCAQNNSIISRRVVSFAEAQKLFKNDPYKLEMIEELKAEEITVYQQGDFIDLCRGGHLAHTGMIKHFKLLSVAGAYWRGDSKNKMLTRIYGVAFFSKKELTKHLLMLEERKERDHRKLGRELGLFMLSSEAGPGLPFWLKQGATIRRIIERYITDKEISLGYEHVYTPILANAELYKTSGHWDHYQDSMFPPMEMSDGEMVVVRPMTCPHHMLIYKNELRSYRDLPLRIAELGMMHRYEKSGALSGLHRVREMTLNDAHIFVRPDQIKEEFKEVMALLLAVYRDFNITDYSFRLSYRDPENKEKFFDDDKMWEEAEKELKNVMDTLNLAYEEAIGEAAFYGPKLDVQVKTALGHEETLSTIQLDFLLPERFQLTYVGEDGKNDHVPVVIHRGIVSTMERFVAYLTEEYKGVFPLWLAPTQVVVIPVNLDYHQEDAKKINQLLKANGFRSELDIRNEKLGYKIRDQQTRKILYSLVIGDQEIANNTVTYRKYNSKEQITIPVHKFIELLNKEVKSKK